MVPETVTCAPVFPIDFSHSVERAWIELCSGSFARRGVDYGDLALFWPEKSHDCIRQAHAAKVMRERRLPKVARDSEVSFGCFAGNVQI